ncbi:TRIM71 [Mytilus coruscus]|uniref:TRIM71 n=1 Tax=Mytilus coruscus TaxID=42192 RepID=A0A6J8AXS9_MYTCO|nr:TRIM71 [Mytilus coruscus]
MEQRASQIGQMQSDFTKMTQYATELQMYGGLKEIETTSSEAAKYIESLESGNHFDEKNLEVFISSDFKSILEDVESFGDININTTFSTLRLKTGRKHQPQHLVPSTDGGTANKTVLLDIEKNDIIQTFKLSHFCNGVAIDNNLVVISCVDESTLVNRNEYCRTILKSVKAYRMALLNGYIYGTNSFQNNVCCFKSTGELLWTFMHPDIASPHGITLDMKGFVYICSYRDHSIVVVSPDGKTSKTILSEADGIKHPKAIDIDRETGIMLVSCEASDDSNDKVYDTALVFKI